MFLKNVVMCFWGDGIQFSTRIPYFLNLRPCYIVITYIICMSPLLLLSIFSTFPIVHSPHSYLQLIHLFPFPLILLFFPCHPLLLLLPLSPPSHYSFCFLLHHPLRTPTHPSFSVCPLRRLSFSFKSFIRSVFPLSETQLPPLLLYA